MAMLARWPLACGAGLVILALVGAPTLWRRPGGKIVIATAATYLAAHTVIYRFGLFASGGYFRFLVPLGPFVALAGAAALGEFWRTAREPAGERALSRLA